MSDLFQFANLSQTNYQVYDISIFKYLVCKLRKSRLGILNYGVYSFKTIFVLNSSEFLPETQKRIFVVYETKIFGYIYIILLSAKQEAFFLKSYQHCFHFHLN